MLGLTIGAPLGGKAIKEYGRRPTYLAASAMSLVGVVITLFLDIYCICVGRLIFGLACGVLSICVPRLIEETVPNHLLSTYGSATNFSATLGGMIACLMGAGLPPDDDYEALK